MITASRQRLASLFEGEAVDPHYKSRKHRQPGRETCTAGEGWFHRFLAFVGLRSKTVHAEDMDCVGCHMVEMPEDCSGPLCSGQRNRGYHWSIGENQCDGDKPSNYGGCQGGEGECPTHYEICAVPFCQ